MNAREILISKLLAGAYILKANGGRTLYEGNRVPVLRVSDSLFRSLNRHHVLKDGKRGTMVISRRAVQRLHGKNAIKAIYRQHINGVRNLNNYEE